MPAHNFKPGFRLSTLDGAFLLASFVVVVPLGKMASRAGETLSEVGAYALLGLPVIAFFLFCNVFHIRRSLELTWAALYVVLLLLAIAFHAIDWRAVATVALLGLAAAIAVDMKSPSYHGVGWRRVNPELPTWWNSQSEHK